MRFECNSFGKIFKTESREWVGEAYDDEAERLFTASPLLLAACKLADIDDRHRWGRASRDTLKEFCRSLGWNENVELLGEFITRFRREAIVAATKSSEAEKEQ